MSRAILPHPLCTFTACRRQIHIFNHRQIRRSEDALPIISQSFVLVSYIKKIQNVQSYTPTISRFNISKPSCFFTYHHANIQNSTWCLLCVQCFVRISEQAAAFALYAINWSVFITVIESVYSAVRTDSLYKADENQQMHTRYSHLTVPYKRIKPPTCTCFGHSCGHPQGGVTQRIHSFIHYYSALRPVRQEPEPIQATGMVLARCILGKFLGVGYHYFPPPLNVPTFVARCLHVHNDATDL
jgi:hypothetical protein